MDRPNRNLDGACFRVCRDGTWQNICFSDLTPDERETVLDGKSFSFIKNLLIYMTDTVRAIGDQLDVFCEDTSDKEEM